MLRNFLHYHACHIFYKQSTNGEDCQICVISKQIHDKMWTGDHRFLAYIFKWER